MLDHRSERMYVKFFLIIVILRKLTSEVQQTLLLFFCRFLYVNCRAWPQGYHIDNPLHPPPIAQEIDIHVIDLWQMCKVETILHAHKAYTPNDECFFIFLDASDEYVAR